MKHPTIEQIKRTEANCILLADLGCAPEVTLAYLEIYVLPLLNDMSDWIGRAPRDQFEDAELYRLKERAKDHLGTLEEVSERYGQEATNATNE